MKNRLSLIIFLFFVALSGCKLQSHSGQTTRINSPRNIILFIGDGMGTAHLYAGMTVSNHIFSIEKFPYSGYSKTASADNYITDSAAGGTAIACGTKTNNGMIGVGPDSVSVPSIMEIAHQNDLSTGIISTSAVTHATPASFVAHNSGRGNYEDIAKDFLNGSIDLFIGGGEDHFRSRKDGVDLTVNLKEQGFSVFYTLNELLNSDSPKIAGLLSKEHMQKASEGRDGELTRITRKAIETLNKNKKGFVLMVEGSMIDWGGHDNNIDYVVAEMIDLDNAISVAKDFAESNNNTLVVVTADHETGGLTLTGGSLSENDVKAKFSGTNHTATMVPVFSLGPGAERFSGIHDNTFFFGEFLNLLNIKN